jgi:hypothetical protein
LLALRLSDDFAERAGGDFGRLVSSEDRNGNISFGFQFESAVQIFKLICDEYAIRRDVLRHVMMSYTAILTDLQSFGISPFLESLFDALRSFAVNSEE